MCFDMASQGRYLILASYDRYMLPLRGSGREDPGADWAERHRKEVSTIALAPLLDGAIDLIISTADRDPCIHEPSHLPLL